MSDLRIVDLDPFDKTMFDEWYRVYDEADRHGRAETATLWAPEELRVTMQEDARRRFDVGWVGLAEDEAVTIGHLRGSLLDNLSVAELAVGTVPSQRGKGHGSAMVAHLEREALRRGRTTVTAGVAWPADGHPEGEGEPYLEFALHRGYALGLVDVQRRLKLPVDESLLDQLSREAAAFHEGYTLRSWAGAVPDELLQGWAELTASLMTEAPLGEMDREPEAVDLAAVREDEALIAQQGRAMYATVAQDRHGEVVAYSNLVISESSERAFQWGTLVSRAHRGHRLGLAVKVANLRLLQHQRPDATAVITWNADVNAHMIGVNERIGFRPVERAGELQKKLA